MHHASAVLTDLKLNTIKMQNNTLLLVTTNRFIGSENIALHKRDRRWGVGAKTAYWLLVNLLIIIGLLGKKSQKYDYSSLRNTME